SAPRVMAVLDPVKVTLTNYDPAVCGSRTAPFHPHHPVFGGRDVPLSREIYIERDDFAEVPLPKWQRLTLGGEVRLR
ncbi:glutamine--tRNA ligase, partial [Staphylococcus aureus]|nr:glutamine--tRNA ligase [Staphylococcus aureus]